MSLFIEVVLWRSLIKIPHDVARRLLRLFIGPLRLDMLMQALQQVQHALNALVASVKHVKRRFITGRRGAMAWQANIDGLGSGAATGHDVLAMC